MKKTLITVMTLFLAAAAWAGQAVPSGADLGNGGPMLAEQEDATKAGSATGGALLDLFVDNMRGMAQSGTPSDIDKRLQEMMLAARKAKDTNAIGSVFFSRYSRMLAVFKLVAVPDATGILVPVIDDFLGAFVRDKLGHTGFTEEGGKGPKAINFVAQALSVELVDLQVYLDTAKERADLTRSLEEKMGAVPSKK